MHVAEVPVSIRVLRGVLLIIRVVYKRKGLDGLITEVLETVPPDPVSKVRKDSYERNDLIENTIDKEW